MGNVAGYRAAFIDAAAYRDKRAKGKGGDGKDDKRDLKLETLAGVLDGDILVHIHCYRADEMATMIDLSKEFDFQIAAFHHGVEAYKIADLLAARSEEHTSELQSLMRISYAVFCLKKKNKKKKKQTTL